jgi:ribosomal protein S18 acetylase RimI-like enzyme
MALAALSTRFATYYSRHGLRSTAHRLGLELRRGLFSNHQVLFCCDLTHVLPPEARPSLVKVERKKSYAELNPLDLHEMIAFWNPKLAQQRIEERFCQGAVLWLIKSEERLAGYGWTLRGGTVESHYFPLSQDDVHFFDFHVFPQYRGRGINPLLVNHILRSLAADGRRRAFIEAAEWNQRQLSSLGRTPFRCFGRAMKWTVLHHTLVWWA